MGDSDKIKMTISIAGQKIPLTVPFNRQDDVRDTESSIGTLYDEWRQRFPKKTDKELLAMIAYQYASYYLSLSRRMQEAVAAVDQLNSRVESAIEASEKREHI